MQTANSIAVQNLESKNEEKPILFKRGLPGLGANSRFTLYGIEGNPLFFYLQSLDEPGVGLILVDPFPFFPHYDVTLGAADKKELQVEKKEEVLVFTTVTLLGENRMTANLAAPIVINVHKRLARQIIIPDRVEEMRTPLALPQK